MVRGASDRTDRPLAFVFSGLGEQYPGMAAELYRTGKVRVVLDWLVGMPFGHDVVDLGSRQAPHAAFQDAARG